ncbi:type II toxin-antitoxin system RelE/ParE family toxin [Pseudomonas sp. 21LCFQ010]|uniref:type II toxin-antitoxin system RelE family toxin n=1 Tax=Pseudomonas sp. 21LCFQ010 TaxID=2957506 RepID=UPI002096C5DC|nr:type II toxin-antitoxin system RelE/ParE family toxin [Pseudomonas sp. 21LCFQ010]MCO8163672.1 type II toxin-antitoxin system RelE/ParE family toxin [Pseudomonas sp. 21LCFQ010]
MSKINWTRRALKQLGKINKSDQSRIFEAAQALAYMPNVQNIKRLMNHQYGYRLRIGRYRVMFDWEASVKIVNIEEVKKRDEHTY